PAEHPCHAGALRLRGERAADRAEADDAERGGTHGMEASGAAGRRKREGRVPMEPLRFNHVWPTLDTVNAGALPHGNATAVGTCRSMSVPSPTWPVSFKPQQYAAPRINSPRSLGARAWFAAHFSAAARPSRDVSRRPLNSLDPLPVLATSGHHAAPHSALNQAPANAGAWQNSAT